MDKKALLVGIFLFKILKFLNFKILNRVKKGEKREGLFFNNKELW